MACRSWDGVTRQLSPFQNDDDPTRNASPPKARIGPMAKGC